jgi:hypothetical protein
MIGGIIALRNLQLVQSVMQNAISKREQDKKNTGVGEGLSSLRPLRWYYNETRIDKLFFTFFTFFIYLLTFLSLIFYQS